MKDDPMAWLATLDPAARARLVRVLARVLIEQEDERAAMERLRDAERERRPAGRGR